MRKLLKSRIFLKQFLAFIMIIIMTFSALAVVLLSRTDLSLEKQRLIEVESYRKEASNQINRWLQGRQVSMKIHAMYIQKIGEDYLGTSEMTAFIKNAVNADADIVDILILDRKGNIINSVGGPKKKNLSEREYFVNGIKGKSTTTGFYKNAINGNIIMSIAEPIFKQGEPNYVIVGVIAHKRVNEVVESLRFGDWGHAYLVNSNGILVSDTQFVKKYINKRNIADSNEYKLSSYAIEQIAKGKSGTGIYNNFADDKVMGSYEWFSPLKVGLIVEFTDSKVMEPIHSLHSFVWILAAYVILGGIFLAFVISKELVTPINMLIKASQNITEKNYEAPMEMKTGSELDILIDEFNKMQSAIHNREVLLEKKNQELRTQRAYAEEGSRLKSQFLANMSHELRTPLNSIIGFTTRVIKKSESLLPQMQLENLNIVKEEAYHLLDLINDLLDYSKIEAGKMEIHPEIFDLKEVLNEVSNMIKPLLDNKPLKYQQSYYTQEKIRIFTDRIKVKQIVINLMSNAIKYSEKGTVVLSVDIMDDNICIKVKDNGIGIAKENLVNIFDEFRQIDGTYTRKVGGTGLGLSITKKFAEMLGGRIEVESELGNGSTFTVYLPTKYVSIEKCVETEEHSACGNEKALRKIICIDDDSNVQRLYKQYLNEDEFEIISLSGQEDVVQRIAEIMPQMILLDIMLPNKDGWNILAEIKDNIITKNIPVIMISVLNERNLAYKMRADEYLVKPITQEELLETIKKFDSEHKGLSIIIVDDDEKYLNLIGQFLKETDCYYRFAKNGEEAIRLMEAKTPHIIMLDLMMPGKDGFSVLEEIGKRPQWKDISIIIVTAKSLTNNERDYLNNRVSHIIEKSGQHIEEAMDVLLKRIKERTKDD